MATNTAGTSARLLPWQATHFLRKPIAYNTSGIGTAATVLLGILPAGAIVKHVLIRVRTAFNAAGNNIIDVGTSSNDDAYVDGGSADVDAEATGTTIVYRGTDEVHSVDTPIYIQYTQTSTAADAGAADIVMEFYPNNDQQS
jgi:hypothetical protein